MHTDPLLLQALERFRAEYGCEPIAGSFAPGRINLIGGHTDYNDGLALPMAIEQRIVTLATSRKDNSVRARSLQIGKPVRFDIKNRERKNRWDDALRGVIDQLEKRGARLSGMDILFFGNVPLEAGLSSSAAFAVSAASCLGSLAGMKFEPKELAFLARGVEHEFMGVQCGILDQMTSAAGKKGHALLLDCRDVSVRPIPIRKPVEIVVCHTGITRNLAASKYNERRAECAEGLGALRSLDPELKSLRDLRPNQLSLARQKLKPEVYSRIKHVVTENERVKMAANALTEGNVKALGKLIHKSHLSLRDDYEVSCPELDAMVEIAVDLPGCLGARLVGAGFGGCVISLVEKANAGSFINSIQSRYLKKTNRDGQFLYVKPGEGAKLYYL